jgi:hypothetical protein
MHDVSVVIVAFYDPAGEEYCDYRGDTYGV